MAEIGVLEENIATKEADIETTEADRYIGYEEDSGFEGQSLTSVCQLLECGYDTGQKPGTGAFRIRTQSVKRQI